MRYSDFSQQIKTREELAYAKSNSICAELLDKYLKLVENKTLSCEGTDAQETLLYEYFCLKQQGREQILTNLLNEYHFNYAMSIHNAIYYLLASDSEKNSAIKPELWPGIESIKKNHDKYILQTILGQLEVYQASRKFLDSDNHTIFNRPLIGKCHTRSYEFLKNNHDYQVVLSYLPNFFYGGHYHSYLVKDAVVLDIAANAYYNNCSNVHKILSGEKLAVLDYKQVAKKIKNIENIVPATKKEPKLLTLSLYYDMHKSK